jgi:hypothetical protein
MNNEDLKRKSIIQQYLKTEDDLQHIGSGAFGTAFLYKGKVYKLTTDLDDYLTAKKLVKRGRRFKHFVKIYSTRLVDLNLEMPSGNIIKNDVYIIVSEYVVPFIESHKENEKAFELWRQFMRYNNDYKILRQGDIPTKNIPEIEGYDSDMINQFFEQMSSVYKELKRLGYRNWDNHSANWGFKDGVIKIFDCGCANKLERQRYNKKRKIVLNSYY